MHLSSTGLTFAPARTPEEVVEAWRLVYRSYRRAGLIPPNPHRLHAMPHPLDCETVVVRGRIRGLTVSTITACLDGPRGLPMDAVYPDELARLRDQGRRLVEVGLLADRRQSPGRSTAALLELMRYATYFGVHGGASDAIIGVHPRHAPFYTRLLGFEHAGPPSTCAAVNHAPVVLLRLNWYAALAALRPPRGLALWTRNPLPPRTFDHRCALTPSRLAGTELAAFFRLSRGAAAA